MFAASPPEGGKSGPSDESVGRDFLLHTANSKTASDLSASAFDASRLLEAVASPANLATALLNVVRNKGAPGVDGRSVKEVLGSARSLLPRLQRAMLDGTYQPGDIRRVWIPKPGGGERGLGIPNVIDQWVQQAVLQVLEPVFEPTFHLSSHGFRPKRGVHTAIAEAKEYVGDGYEVVGDIDLSKFFDRVHHQRLLSRLGQKVTDSRILKLIGRMLKAKVVMPDGTRVSTGVHSRGPQQQDHGHQASGGGLPERRELQGRDLLLLRWFTALPMKIPEGPIFLAEIERLLLAASGFNPAANTPASARPRLGGISPATASARRSTTMCTCTHA